MRNKSSGRKSGFRAVLSFEYMSYLKNKAFIISTIVVILLIALGSLIPAIIIGFSSGDDEDQETEEKPKIAVVNYAYESNDAIVYALQKEFDGNEVVTVKDNIDKIESDVENGKYEFAVVLEKPLSYKYITNTSSIFDSTDTIDSAVAFAYKTTELEKKGITSEQSKKLLNAYPTREIITLGKDQTTTYLSTYILLMLLYIAILSYGQMVCNSVVTEKSSRAMEMLITCAKPSDLMFGKVIGAGLAGFTQAAAIAAVGVIAFSASSTMMPIDISSIFSFPVESAAYAMLFFVLAFFIYAFVMAALASLVSRAEDMNNLITPIMLVFIFAVFVVIFGINSGELDTPLMIITSYIPFTAPMSMFARVTMSDVAAWEIIVSVAVQIVSIYILGRLAAAIYRIGVLLYGKPPKLREVFKMLKAHKAASKS